MIHALKKALRRLKTLLDNLLNKALDGTHDHFACHLPPKTGFLTSLVLRFFLFGIGIDEKKAAKLKGLEKEGVVVYVNKYKSRFEFLLHHTRYQALGLPFPEIGFYYNFPVLLPLTRLLRIFLSYVDYFFRYFHAPDPFISGFIRNQLLEGKAGFFSLIDKKGFQRRFIKAKTDPVRYLIEIQHTIDRPVFVIPQLIFYSKRPIRTSPTLIDFLFGAEESPGRIRRLITLVQKPKKIFVENSEPVNLKEFLSIPRYRTMSIDQQARTLREYLLSTIDRHRRSIIGPVLKSRVELKESVLTNRHVQQFIQQHAKEEAVSIRHVQKKANDYIEEIAANYSQNWIQVFDLSLRLILRMLFDGMVIDMEGLARIKELSTKGPLVLVPCHKSHLDYLILSFIFHHNNMPCPHIAAGKNLSFWPMGTIFRGGGAFFLRRTFKGNMLYSIIFSRYIYKILQEGFNIEFFIEGTRSRTGKLLMPKLGLLSIIVESYLKGACDDILFVPIFIGYDRVIEEKSYLHEVEGGQKEPESLKQVIKARKTLKKRYGKVYVNFHDPLSLKEYLHDREYTSHELSRETQKEICQDLGFRFVNGINHVAVVTPYGVVASAILNISKKRVPYETIEAYLTVYMDYLISIKAKRSDSLLSHDHQKTFNSVLSVFVQRKFIEQAISNEEERLPSKRRLYKVNESRRPGLDYYKNNCINFFVPAAFTAVAVLETDAFQFSSSDLITTYHFLRELFINEFAFDVDKTPTVHIRKTLKAFIDIGMLVPHPTLPETYTLTSAGLKKIKFFAAFLKTYLESYLVVLHFFIRYPAQIIEGKDRIKKIQSIGNRMYNRKEIEHVEALSKISYLNADKHFMDLGLDKESEKETVESFVEKIQHYLNVLQP
ncbi:MAG: 1-acyl-sn-glycerol-3-phosphate acyltransferase [Thermodesulfobacteriota bacterium]